MKKSIRVGKTKAKQQAPVAEPAAARLPEPVELAASIGALAEAMELLKPIVEAEAAAMQRRDPSALSELQARKSAVIQLLRGSMRVVTGARRGGLKVEDAACELLLTQCKDALAAMQVNQRSIAAARSATHQRIQSLLQARQRAQGAILVYGPDGQGRTSGRWSDRRDLSPAKA
jgi:hypothetical protein